MLHLESVCIQWPFIVDEAQHHVSKTPTLHLSTQYSTVSTTLQTMQSVGCVLELRDDAGAGRSILVHSPILILPTSATLWGPSEHKTADHTEDHAECEHANLFPKQWASKCCVTRQQAHSIYRERCTERIPSRESMTNSLAFCSLDPGCLSPDFGSSPETSARFGAGLVSPGCGPLAGNCKGVPSAGGFGEAPQSIPYIW
jgi:hypothetical protein